MPQNDSASVVYYQIRDPEEQAVSKMKRYGHSEIAATAYDRLSVLMKINLCQWKKSVRNCIKQKKK